MKSFYIASVAALAGISALTAEAVILYGKNVEENYVKYVDVFTGTAATGHTTPAAAYPFGMVQAGPDTGTGDSKWSSSYRYDDGRILGFSQSHLNGTGGGEYGDVQIVYGSRSKADLVDYKEIIDEWMADEGIEVNLTIDREQEGWDGHVGFIPNFVKELNPDLKKTVLMCGPPVMIKFTLQELMALGFEKTQVYTTMELKMKYLRILPSDKDSLHATFLYPVYVDVYCSNHPSHVPPYWTQSAFLSQRQSRILTPSLKKVFSRS